MKVQSKWGIEVEAERWGACPNCGNEEQVGLWNEPEDELVCGWCGNHFTYGEVTHGRLKWQFLGTLTDELVEQIISELRADAEEHGATFTAERTDQ